MKVSHQEIDALNALVTVAVKREDYQEKVTSILNDYRKKANIPGFRKGHVPMGLIKKQYQTAVTADEVNKLLQEHLDSYLKKENLSILGNPLPKMQDEIDWAAPQHDFEFELGLAPKFDINLKSRKKVTQYVITAEEKMIDEQVVQLQKQFGKIVAQTTIKEGFEVTAHFQNEDLGIDTTSTFTLADIKGKKNIEVFQKAQHGATFSLESKSLFKEPHLAQRYFGVSNEKVAALSGLVQIALKEINERILAPLNQELFDKVYEAGTVKSEAEMRDKIKQNIEQQFEQQSDQKLLNDITDFLIDSTKFDLPDTFLKKWLQTSGEKQLTEDEATAEYERSIKGIRYQLIEGKIIADNDLQIQFDELKEFAQSMLLQQMGQYGQQAPDQEQLDGIVARVLSNQEETRRLSEQLMSKKLLAFYKENAPLKPKKLPFSDFVKEAYGQG